MTSQQPDEERIFHLAREIQSSSTRSEYLDQICAGDQALRERVSALLEIHDREQNFLKSGGPVAPTVEPLTLTESPGVEIGRFKLLQKIGEGGFGVVYMAEQVKPVRRKVALKIIKPGMDTETVMARFEAERQALAMMDHVNIARVFDGGATDSGRPYFVMELVKGVPITDYCDKNQLSTERRLELFITVCHAVQHAHQKGIIHRDLKPSNVLVTLADGQPIVKVIDFGVAKATNQTLTEKTLFTAFGQMVGTPQYMSPEQAEMSSMDVDTRSDVYSLGVLLYELLTGTTPLESEKLRTAGLLELQRLIREVEPPKPSTRLSSSGDNLTIIAKHRSVTPERLGRLVRGDLDWIVMKAIEKDRTRRYESPSELCSDVGNFLNGDPVVARPPTFGYRSSKYLRRHRVVLTVAGLLIASLGIGLAIANSQRVQLQRTLDELQDVTIDQLLASALSADGPEAWTLAIKEAEQRRVPPEWIDFGTGLRLFFQGEINESAKKLRSAVDKNSSLIPAASMLVVNSCYTGNGDEFARYLRLVESSEPQSDRDRLFIAYTRMFDESERAVDELKTIVSRRPSWLLAQTMLAEAEAYLAMDRASPELLEDAAAKTQLMTQWLPDNPYVAAIDLLHRPLQLRMSLTRGRDSTPKLIQDLRESLVRTERWRQLDGLRFWSVALVEEPEEAIPQFETAIESPVSDEVIAEFATYLMRQDRRNESLSEALPNIRPHNYYALTTKAFWQAIMDRDFDAAEQTALSIVEGEASPRDRIDALSVLLMLGKHEDARQRASELRHQVETDGVPILFESRGELLKGLADGSMNLRFGSWEKTSRDVCYSNFMMAMDSIGKGDADHARKHLKACVKTDAMLLSMLSLAEAILPHVETLSAANSASHVQTTDVGDKN